MKKKILLTGITITVFIALAIYLLYRPQSLGNMKNRFTEETTTTSSISFSGKAGDKIRFSFQSEIKAGDLNILLYDSKDNAVYQLDHAKSLKCFFTLPVSGTYTLAAECSDFIGDYSIKVYDVHSTPAFFTTKRK